VREIAVRRAENALAEAVEVERAAAEQRRRLLRALREFESPGGARGGWLDEGAGAFRGGEQPPPPPPPRPFVQRLLRLLRETSRTPPPSLRPSARRRRRAAAAAEAAAAAIGRRRRGRTTKLAATQRAKNPAAIPRGCPAPPLLKSRGPRDTLV